MPRRRKDSLKAIAHLRDHTVLKGYIDDVPVQDVDELLRGEPASLPSTLSLRLAKAGYRETATLTLDSLKALFFVKTFAGRREYKEIKFFEAHPPIEGLWVRLRFYDNEFTEGVVRNSLSVLVEPGFFLKPPDPHSNNKMIYVIKSSLREFRVLGLRGKY